MPPRGKAKTDGGKRYPLNMRTTKVLRDRLEEAAELSGRSLAQEVEYRLERSFDREATVFDFVGPRYRKLAKGLFTVLMLTQVRIKDASQSELDASIYLAAITTVLATADASIKELEDRADIGAWLYSSIYGIAMARQTVSLDEAMRRASDIFPRLVSGQLTLSFKSPAKKARRPVRRSAKKTAR